MTDPSAHHQGDAPPVDERTPISFIVMLVLAVLYLGWRLVQGVIAAIGWLS